MTPDEALQVLDDAAARALMDRAGHWQAARAVQALRAALAPKPAGTPEAKADAVGDRG